MSGKFHGNSAFFEGYDSLPIIGHRSHAYYHRNRDGNLGDEDADSHQDDEKHQTIRFHRQQLTLEWIRIRLSKQHNSTVNIAFISVPNCISAVKPNTHQRYRRDSTVKSSRRCTVCTEFVTG